MMHKNEPRGRLTFKDRPLTIEEIASLMPGDKTAKVSLIEELLSKDVASRDQAGAIVSKRMLNDEHLRRQKSEAGKRGGIISSFGKQTSSRQPSRQPSRSQAECQAHHQAPPGGGKGGCVSASVSVSSLEGGVGETKPTPPRVVEYRQTTEAVPEVDAATSQIIDTIYAAFPNVGGGWRTKAAIAKAIDSIKPPDLLAAVKRYAASATVVSELANGRGGFLTRPWNWVKDENWRSFQNDRTENRPGRVATPSGKYANVRETKIINPVDSSPKRLSG
jgi:hypothetical protein